MGTVVRIPFEVAGWDPEPLSLGESEPVAFGRVTLRKTFSGPLTGTSVVSMTSAAVADAGVVLPGTGTGELTGIAGTVTIEHEERGAVLVLEYDVRSPER